MSVSGSCTSSSINRTFRYILILVPELFQTLLFSITPPLFHSKSFKPEPRGATATKPCSKCPSQPLRRLDFTPCLDWHPVQQTIVPPPRPFAMPNPPRTTNFPKREEDDPSLPFKEQQTPHLSPLPLVPRVVATRPIGIG